VESPEDLLNALKFETRETLQSFLSRCQESLADVRVFYGRTDKEALHNAHDASRDMGFVVSVSLSCPARPHLHSAVGWTRRAAFDRACVEASTEIMKFVDDDVRNAHPDSGQGSALLGERRDAFLRVLMGNIEEQNAIRKGLFAIRRWVAIVKYTTPAKAMVRYIPNQAESGH
jgi:hypothetical protein